MHRCTESEGRFRVSLRVANEKGPYRVQVIGHRDVLAEVDGVTRVVEPAPVVGTTEPYEGELCTHELAWLNGVPGKDWRPEYEWDIQPLEGAAKAPRSRRG